MLSAYKNDSVWADTGGLDASALIPFELGGTMLAPKQVPVSVMDLGKMLLHCSREGETNKVRELLGRGAPFTTDWLGTSPLHVAACNNHYDTCDALLRAGISKNARTKVDRTPLHIACYEGHDQIVELLLENNCEVDALDMLRMTPLHWSVERKFRKCVDLLLKHGADPSVKSKFDKTPLSIALETAQTDVFEELMIFKMKIGDPEQQQAADSLQFELNRSREQDPIELIQTDDDLISPSPSPTHSSASDHMSDNERLNANGIEIDESISKLQSIEVTKEPADASTALQLLKHHGISMIEDADGTLLNSALQSGRKLVVSDAGKLILNDPKFKRVFSTEPHKFSTANTKAVTRPAAPAATSSAARPLPKFTTNGIPSNAIRLEQLRKKPTAFTPPSASKPMPTMGNGMPLKTNKVIKILSAEEFKQMCGANSSSNTLKRIATDSLQNGNLKYQAMSNANILTQLSRSAKKPILNKIKLNTLPPAVKSSILNEIKISGIKPIGTHQLQKILPNRQSLPSQSPNAHQTLDPDTEYISRLSFNQSKALAAAAAANTSTTRRPSASTSFSTASPSTSTASVASTSHNRSHSQPASTPKAPMGLSEIERQLLELKKQTDELRRQLDQSQRQNEEYKVRLERLEREKEEEKEERYRHFANT